MTINKHHNFDISGTYPDNVGDAYYSQDLIRDFNYHRDQLGLFIKDATSKVPFLVSGGTVTQGAGDTLNITSGVGYVKFSVKIPNDSTVIPASLSNADVEAIRVAWTQQTNLVINTATLNGAATNYVKVKYAETDLNLRNRAYSSGTYYCERVPSYTFVVDTVSPTDYDLCLYTLVGSAGGTFTLTPYAYTDLSHLNSNSILRNAIINGDMMIAQRGVSFAAIASGSYSLDRWAYNLISATAFHTITQDTTSPLGSYCLKLDCTTADILISAGDLCFLSQKIEGYNFIPFVKKTATLSFWVCAVKPGIYCVSFVNGGIDRSYVAEYTIYQANTWEKKEITVTFDYSGGTWYYDYREGLRIAFTIAAGSTFQTTANAWQTGEYYGTSNQVNGMDNTANNFYLTGVQLNIGSKALPYNFLSYRESLNQCRRYFYRANSVGYNYNTFGNGYIDNANDAWYSIIIPTEMRTYPTLAVSSGSDFRIAYAGGSSVTTGITLVGSSNQVARVKATEGGGGLTAGWPTHLISDNKQTSYIDFSADI
jgi:hypothetical protein